MRLSIHRDFLNVWACSLMVWLSWNPVVYAGVLRLFSLIVSYAEAKADVVVLVGGQNWDFWAVANSTAVWSATWKTTGWQTKEPFFGNMNLGTSHGCWLKSGTLLWMPIGRGGSLLRLTGTELLISTAKTTTARKTCDSGQKLTIFLIIGETMCHRVLPLLLLADWLCQSFEPLSGLSVLPHHYQYFFRLLVSCFQPHHFSLWN